MPTDESKWTPKYKIIANKIYQEIITGKLMPGSKLPGGRLLATRYGVSKNTIYEALEFLERGKIIEIKKDLGSYVTKEAWGTSANGDPNWESYINHGWLSLRSSILDNVLCMEDENSSSYIYLSLDCLHDEFGADKYTLLALDAAKSEVANNSPFAKYEFQGMISLRKTVAEFLSKRWHSNNIDYRNIIITPGGPNAMEVVLKGISSQGDIIYTEKPASCLPLQHLLSLGQRIVGIDMDENGIDVDMLHNSLRKSERPMLMVTPNGHYPTGVVMSIERRKELIELCNAVSLPIIELDSMYDMENELPSLKSMDKNNIVIYIGALAHSYAFGVCTGWIIPPDYLVKRLAVVSMESNHYPSHITHIITEKLIANGYYDDFIAQFIPKYHMRMELALELLNKYFSDIASWYNKVRHRLIYLRMNDGISVKKMAKVASGVRFASGAIFDRDDNSHIIINPFAMSESEFEEGLKRLRKAALACLQ